MPGAAGSPPIRSEPGEASWPSELSPTDSQGPRGHTHQLRGKHGSEDQRDDPGEERVGAQRQSESSSAKLPISAMWGNPDYLFRNSLRATATTQTMPF